MLGAPLWLPLLIAAAAVVFSLYVSLWSIIVSLWSVFASLVGCCIGGLAGGVGLLIGGRTLPGVALLAAGMVCAGLSIFAFFGCRAATKGTVWLGKRLALGIKRCFV